MGLMPLPFNGPHYFPPPPPPVKFEDEERATMLIGLDMHPETRPGEPVVSNLQLGDRLLGSCAAVVGVLMFVLTACMTVTSTYGRRPQPVPDKPDTFEFTIHFNAVASSSGVAKAAEKEFVKFRDANGYTGYQVENSTCAGASCTYTVRYAR